MRHFAVFGTPRCTLLFQAIAGIARGTLGASIFHALGEVVAGFTLRALRIRGACARFRHVAAINLGAGLGGRVGREIKIYQVAQHVSVAKKKTKTEETVTKKKEHICY